MLVTVTRARLWSLLGQFLGLGLDIIIILTRICGPPIKGFKEIVECCGEKRSECGSQPINPVVVRERVVHHIGCKGAHRIYASTTEIDAWRRGEQSETVASLKVG
jgi:hypothetical protein